LIFDDLSKTWSPMFKMIDTAARRMARITLMLAMALLVGLLASPAQQVHAAAVEAVAVPGKDVTIAPVLPPEVANPYGLGALWEQGDFVARSTLIILVLMSMGSWYILITRLRASLRLRADARQAQAMFASAVTVHQLSQGLRDGSAFRFVAEAGLHASERQAGTLMASIDRGDWLTMSVQRSVEQVQSRLNEGLALLATVGSTAPFIGLFGTVWGIYHALTAIGIAGQASIDKVAGPVGEALIMTAIGLAVAVPAVLGYNALARRNKVTMEAVRSFAADVHAVLSSKGAR
jgi:biopolymer transport protein ExbB